LRSAAKEDNPPALKLIMFERWCAGVFHFGQALQAGRNPGDHWNKS
jgi:hypothetical protein